MFSSLLSMEISISFKNRAVGGGRIRAEGILLTGGTLMRPRRVWWTAKHNTHYCCCCSYYYVLLFLLFRLVSNEPIPELWSKLFTPTCIFQFAFHFRTKKLRKGGTIKGRGQQQSVWLREKSWKRADAARSSSTNSRCTPPLRCFFQRAVRENVRQTSIGDCWFGTTNERIIYLV